MLGEARRRLAVAADHARRRDDLEIDAVARRSGRQVSPAIGMAGATAGTSSRAVPIGTKRLMTHAEVAHRPIDVVLDGPHRSWRRARRAHAVDLRQRRAGRAAPLATT